MYGKRDHGVSPSPQFLPLCFRGDANGQKGGSHKAIYGGIAFMGTTKIAKWLTEGYLFCTDAPFNQQEVYNEVISDIRSVVDTANSLVEIINHEPTNTVSFKKR